jgi:hypothetical protein
MSMRALGTMTFVIATLLWVGCGEDLVADRGGVDGGPGADAEKGGEAAAGTEAGPGGDTGSDSVASHPDGPSSTSEGGGAGGPCSDRPDGAPASKLVFVSSAVYTGDLGGLSGADAKCQGLATAAGLRGTYRAWLSDGFATVADRLCHSMSSYVLVTGALVAANWTELVSGNLSHYIDVTEKGDPLSLDCSSIDLCPCGGTGGMVWTGTAADGTLCDAALDCQNWTSSISPNAAWGEADPGDAAATSNWTTSCNGGPPGCSAEASIYCFEQ